MSPERQNTQGNVRHVVGCMTGTSMDGLDVSLVRIEGHGLDMQAECIASASFDFPESLQGDLRKTARQFPMTAGDFARIALDFGEFHARNLAKFVSNEQADPDLIAVHGQTVFHDPPHSWQLINPNPIARDQQCPVIFDLRAADLAADGEGAPITPIVDAMLFADVEQDIAIVNLGGFASYTRLRHIDRNKLSEQLSQVEAGDICVCNQLLDRAAQVLLNQPYDESGDTAAKGCKDDDAINELAVILRAQSMHRRSLGTGDECTDWIDKWKARIPPSHVLMSIVASLASVIHSTIADADMILIAGGGVKNLTLLLNLQSMHPNVWDLDMASTPNHEYGFNHTNRESVAMAILGALSQDGVPITLPQVTRCSTPDRAPIAGTWVYPP